MPTSPNSTPRSPSGRRKPAAEGRGVRFLPRALALLCGALRDEIFGTIELRPGIDPTARHIEQLISSMKAEHVPIVVREPQFPEKVPRLIAEQPGQHW